MAANIKDNTIFVYIPSSSIDKRDEPALIVGLAIWEGAWGETLNQARQHAHQIAVEQDPVYHDVTIFKVTAIKVEGNKVEF